MKRIFYLEIGINDIRENLDWFLAWLLRVHEVIVYAFDGERLTILLERRKEEIIRLIKDIENGGIRILNKNDFKHILKTD